MDKIENLEKCIWKIMAEDKSSTTFQDVTESHKLYKCVVCSGEYGTCEQDTRIKTKYEKSNPQNPPII